MKFFHILFAAFLVLMLSGTEGYAGKFDHLSAPQLLDEMDFKIDMIKRTEEALLENDQIAEQNEQKLNRLNQKNAELGYKDTDLGNRINQYNQEVDNYNGQCASYELGEAAYNSCVSWKSNLDSRQYQLDQEGYQLDRELENYNRDVSDFNQDEKNRAWAAEQLVRKYNEYADDIGAIMLRLNSLGAIQNLENFTNQNQACADLPSLEDMHQCMQNLWDGARR